MNYTIIYHKPGDDPIPVYTGDLIFTRGKNWYSNSIRLGQMIEAKKLTGPAREINHMALGKYGYKISEALGHGIVESDIRKYNDFYYAVVRTDVHNIDEYQILEYIRVSEDNNVPYGWVTIGSLALSALFGSRANIGINGTMICSGYACQAMIRAGHIYEKVDANFMTPHMAAEKYGVDLPYF